MSNFRLTVWLFCSVLLLQYQYALAVEFTEEEQRFINENPTIIVGGETDWPPMDFVQNGVYSGAAKDFLDEISAVTKINFKVVTGYTWPELLDLLRARKIDMIPMIYWTADRGREFNFTDPYITVRHYVFVREDRQGISNFGDFSGLTIAIPKGYAHIDYLLRDHPNVRILEVPTILNGIDAVLTGGADAIIENTSSVAYYTKNQNIVGLKPAFPVQFEVDNVHMAIRKDRPLLRDIMQKALNAISAERSTDIMAKWTGSEAAAKTFLTSKAELSSAETDYLRGKGQLTACINAERMPHEGRHGNEHIGITHDYLRVLSGSLRVPISVRGADTAELSTARFRSGGCDLISNWLVTKNVSNGIAHTIPLFEENLALVTNSTSGFYASLDELMDEKIGVVDGYTDLSALKLRHADIEFIEFPTLSVALDALVDAEVYGVVDYVPTINDALSRRNEANLKISGSFADYPPGTFAMAVPADAPLLLSAINKVFESMPDSTQQNIRRKWVAASIETRTDYSLLIQSSIVALAILIFLGFRFLEVRRHREAIFEKNIALKQVNAQLAEKTDTAMHMAYHDQLTGLPNRAKLLSDLDHSLRLCRRLNNQLSVLFLDLDRFKAVNDTLGHDIGDELLKLVARRLRTLLRDTDLLCRVGGDEFVIVLEAITDEYSPCFVAERIVAALNQPFEILQHTVSIGTSVGIAVFPGDSDDLHALIKYADSAMYQAKDGGRNGYRYYSQDISEKANRRSVIETALRRSIQDQDFRLAIQPIIDLRTNRVTKAEALIRWEHKELGNIPPDEFIPIAEEFGLIVEIGEWVLQETCRVLSRVDTMECGIDAISINVSSVEFLSGRIAQRFSNIMAEHKISPNQIAIEITERYMLDQNPDVEADLEELRNNGHPICVDDFGTGYSSLSYMKRLPLQVIKIDRSFIQNIPTDQDDVEISQAIVSLSHNLGYVVVAEGVETAEQLTFLQDRRCDYAQGYYFSAPVSVDDLLPCVLDINERLRAGAPIVAVSDEVAADA